MQPTTPRPTVVDPTAQPTTGAPTTARAEQNSYAENNNDGPPTAEEARAGAGATLAAGSSLLVVVAVGAAAVVQKRDEVKRRWERASFGWLPSHAWYAHAEPVDFPGDARRWFAYAEAATPLARARPLGVEAAPLLTDV